MNGMIPASWIDDQVAELKARDPEMYAKAKAWEKEVLSRPEDLVIRDITHLMVPK